MCLFKLSNDLVTRTKAILGNLTIETASASQRPRLMGSQAGRAASELSMQKALSQLLHLFITCLFQINDNLDTVLCKEA